MKPIIIMALIVLAIGAAAIYYINQPASLLNSTPSASDQIFNKDTSQLAQTFSDNYLEYNPQAFEAAKDKKRILFFYADWCPECRPADADFKTNSNKIPQGVIVFRVNYNDTQTDDEEQRLAAKYGITYQHTYIQVDKDGQEITKWHGGSLNNLFSKIK